MDWSPWHPTANALFPEAHRNQSLDPPHTDRMALPEEDAAPAAVVDAELQHQLDFQLAQLDFHSEGDLKFIFQ